MLTKQEFGAVLAVLGIGTGKTIKANELDVWFDCLKDLPLSALQTAIARYLCEGDDWPSIAKIRKLASASMHGECLSFGEAFDRMLSAVRQHGFYNEPKAREILDSLTWRTVQGLGGWEGICDSPTDQRSTLRAQFRMVYEGLRDREEKHRALPEAVRPRIKNPGQRRIEGPVHSSVPLPEIRDPVKVTNVGLDRAIAVIQLIERGPPGKRDSNLSKKPKNAGDEIRKLKEKFGKENNQ